MGEETDGKGELYSLMKSDIKKYGFKHGLPLEFEIVNLTKVFSSKKEMMVVPHRAQFYHILWIEKGAGTHYIDFNPVKLEDHQIIFVPHNSVNLFDEEGIYEGKSIIFTDNFFCKNPDDVRYLNTTMLYSDLYDTAVLNKAHNSELKAVFNAMEVEFDRQPDNMQYGILHSLLHIFLFQAEREMRQQGYEELKPCANLDYLILFKDLLEKNFHQERSVNKYARELSISDKQLHKATTTLLDKTPKQLIDERVLLEAKRLLVHSNQSIKEIAYELGYGEPTNFIKYFRKHTEATPSEFREQY
ncbi:helix-turn-helix domain-containing protein [Carboxylicivirga sp. A043]|uniref:AraC family transcriptional regulator n=1 Tax=Carboxylicivirga litoralis TaxID=2816963 RepID=UPI0021CB2BE9|nr:helix-turn-helix domain-containing protein [Carboxylicivirga sp. A043]MCU4154489.1 helix-turn-helix domain-containing protein [Carboxylicivirga sp. A043]